MNIIINDKQKLLSSAAIDRTETKSRSAFAKFSDHVKSVEISVEDINGPKGGIDKQCRVLVKMRRLNDVSVTVNESAISSAIPGAIDRAARSVRRALDKRWRTNNASQLRLQA